MENTLKYTSPDSDRGESHYDARMTYFQMMKFFMDEEQAPSWTYADGLIDEYLQYEKRVSNYLQDMLSRSK